MIEDDAEAKFIYNVELHVSNINDPEVDKQTENERYKVKKAELIAEGLSVTGQPFFIQKQRLFVLSIYLLGIHSRTLIDFSTSAMLQ